MLTNSDPSCSNNINHSNPACLRIFSESPGRRDEGNYYTFINLDPNCNFQKEKYSAYEERCKFSLEGPTYSLFLRKAHTAHFLGPTPLWTKAGLAGFRRLLLRCFETKQRSLKARSAARRWWLVLTTMLRGDGSTPPRSTHRTMLTSARAVCQAREQTRCCHKSKGLFPAVARIRPDQTLTLLFVNILV